MTDAPADKNSPTPKRTAGRWIALTLAVLLAILLPFVLLEDRVMAWTAAAFDYVRSEPWLGGGLVVGLLAGDVLLPVPSSIVSAAAGVALGWKLAAATIWLGMTIGCVVGYGLGASAGRGVALRVVGPGEMERARRLFANIGPVALIVTRGVPVLAEASTLAAGAAAMPFWLFLLSTSVANLGVALAYAGVGALAASSGSFLIIFIGLATVPAIGWAVWRIAVRRAPS